MLGALRRYHVTAEGFGSSRFHRIHHIKLLIDGGRLDHDLRWAA
jgi:hypothetical protein